MSAPRLSSGILIVREDRIVYASDGVGALTGRSPAALVGEPWAAFVVPEERTRIADRHARRLRGEGAPEDYEITLLLPDGGRRSVDLHVDRDGADALVHLSDRSAQAARRLRLEAIATLGAAIQRERTEAAVYRRVLTGLVELGVAAAILDAEADGVRLRDLAVPPALEHGFHALTGEPLRGYLARWGPFGRRVFEVGLASTDESGADAAVLVPGAADGIRKLALDTGVSRAVAVRLEQRTPARAALLVAGDWLTAEDVPALRLFAAQVAAALDAAHAIAELSRQNADLAALNRIGVLAGEAADLEALFGQADALLRETTGCIGIALYVLDEPLGALTVAYDSGATPELRALFARVPSEAPLVSVLRERTARVYAVEADTFGADAFRRAGVTCAALVPLVARSNAVGAMAVRFAGPVEVARGRLELLCAVGAHFASAIEARGLLSDLRRRVAELTLSNDLAVASAQLDPVLLLENVLRRLCETLDADDATGWLREGERLTLVARIGADDVAVPAGLDIGDGPVGRAVERLGPVAEREPPGGPGAAARIAVPLLAKLQTAVGAIGLRRRSGRSFSEDEVRLLSAVAVQLGVAVENARLFEDVRRRLADLEAVHGLALRIFGNAPGDVKALLDDGCREAARALSCRAATIFLVTEGGATLRSAATWGTPFDASSLVLPLARDGLAQDAILRRAPAWSEDVTKDPRSAMYGHPRVPPTSMLAVPLVGRDATRGVLYLADDAGRTFRGAELALANALAGELAVGLENAELYAEARERLSELSTVIDVARVVSSSLDLEEVLGTGAEHLMRTLQGSGCTILLEDPRGRELRRAASRGLVIGPPVLALSEPTLATRARDARAPVVGPAPAGEPAAALLAVPLHVRDQPVGVALVAGAGQARAFSAGELSRAMAIASQLAVAVDNARLYSETRRRAEELGLLHEVGRSLVATLDIEQVLDAGARNLARMVDAPQALLALTTADGTALEVRAVWGAPPQLVGERLPLGVAGGGPHRRAEPVVVEDALTDPRVELEIRARTGARAYLMLPLLVRDRLIGAAVIVETRGPRRFGPSEVERAAAIANQLAVAAENARLYEDLRRSYAELAHAQRQLIQKERLAALGELSAVVAHEVRNPLGVIFNSLGSLRRLLRPTGDARMLFDIVGEEADRLNRIVGDLLDFARPATPVLRSESLDRVVDEAVAAALVQNPAGVEVSRETDPALPPVPMDARLVRQAILNLAVNAVQAMPRGGRLVVRTRREETAALLELEDTGAGIPEDVRGRIFEPFFTTKASGTGLGLAVVKRIVDNHGGEITVRSRPGAGTLFSLRFPLEPPAGADGEALELEAGLG